MMKLYTFWRSSAAYRVRIALNLKGLAAELVPVHLRRDGGEQNAAAYKALNPAGLVPTLVDGERVLTQSLAIIEYLEETRPEPALLPRDAGERAWQRAFAQVIACDIHPLDNLRVLQYLKAEMDVGDEARDVWYRHWVDQGFAALEEMVAHRDGASPFAGGDRPMLADVALVPQMANARRLDVAVERYPHLVRIDANCRALPEFQAAAPEAQPDRE